MFKIGDFSKLCRVPVSALRYYADIGLLEPSRVDPFTGYRYYSLDQLPRLNRILALRDLGLSLDQVGYVLRENLPAEQIRGMLRLREAEIRQTISAEQARLAQVEMRLKQIEQEGQMPGHDVVLKTVEPQHVLAIRETIPTPDGVATLLGESFYDLMGQQITPIAAPMAIFHDPEFLPANLDVEIAIPVARTAPGTVALAGGRQLAARTLPGIEHAACLLHVNVFDTIPDSYTALGQWIEASGYQIAGPPREVYLREPRETEPPITEIQMPVTQR